jgi:hypothetical protein
LNLASGQLLLDENFRPEALRHSEKKEYQTVMLRSVTEKLPDFFKKTGFCKFLLFALN